MTPLDSPTASRDFALQHLEAILPSLGRSYASTRNYDLGPGQHKNVSGVSPWVRHRLVLEEELVSAALGAHGFVAPEKFIQEVFWRTYWKGWLELRPDVWHQYKRSLAEDLERLSRDDDLALHNLNTDSHDIIGVAGVSTTDHRSPGTVSATVRVFADQTLSEAVAAFTNNRNVASRTFEADNPEAIIDWAVTLGASSVLAPYAPVGPGAEFLDQVQQTADRCGKRFERLVRPWDATCWPKATQGFFRFKQAIPSIIAQLDLPRPVPFSCSEKA